MANSFEHISITAVKVLARLAAKKAVEAELRAQGVRVTLVRPAEIAAQAQAYLQSHPELIDAARERALRLGMFEKKPKRLRQIMVTPDRLT
jgi:NAD(P)-dependent dehydrogenase (short-subunit alcohol dehydrogenase family)